MKKSFLLFFGVFFVLTVFLTNNVFALAGINRKINFQGKVVKNDGTNVVDNNYNFQFSLWTTATVGTSLWSEVWNAGNSQIGVSSGIFSVDLGTNTTFPPTVNFNDDTLYLSIGFSGEADMSPRIRLTAVPYAFNAEKVGGLTVTNTTGTLTIPNGKTISFADGFTTVGAGITLDQSLATTNSVSFAGLSIGGSVAFTNIPVSVGTTVLFIDSGGKITKGFMSSGVGTTYAAINGLTLNVSNQIGLGGTLSADTRLNIGNTDVMYFELASGNVGIGTTNPNNLLSVYDLIDFNNTDFNTKLGFQSGKNIVAGAQYNTFVGYQAGLSSNTLSTNAAGYNSAFGYRSLYSNTTGYNNSAQGAGALYSNTTGYNNSAQGAGALGSNTTGSYNSAQGYAALSKNTTGLQNSAQGVDALFKNTTGNRNSAQGAEALYYNTTGSDNSVQGFFALYSNTGNNNSAQGSYALFSITTGNQNSAQGAGALQHLIGAYDNNTAIGYFAGRFYNGTTGSLTAISNSLFLGASASALNGAGDTNEIVIGYNAIGNGSNSVVLGNDSITKTILKGNVGIGTTNPIYKLDVAGDINLTGTIRAAGTTGSSGQVLSSNGAGSMAWISSGGIGTTYSAGSGLTLASNIFKLGGTLTENMRLNIGNTEALFIDYINGNVGIGTTNPNASLEIKTSGTEVLRLNSTNEVGASVGYFHMYDNASEMAGFRNGGAGKSWDMVLFTVGRGLRFAPANNTVFETGNVSIGNVTPLSKLGVAGNASIGSAYGSIAAPTSGLIVEGNVGIGTTGPGTKLDITGSLSQVGTVENVLTLNRPFNSGVAFEGGVGFAIGRNAGDLASRFDIVMDSNNDGVKNYNTTVMTMLSTGNVGIGTTNPIYKLDVAGDINLTGTIRAAGTTGSSGQVLSSNGAGSMAWISSGGIGTTYAAGVGLTLSSANIFAVDYDTANLALTGNKLTTIQPINTTASVTFAKLGLGSTHALYLLNVGGTANFTDLFASGNVGIGTTSPNNLLSVYDLIDFNNTDFNTKLGFQSGKNIVAGAQYNTFVGYQAGLSSNTLSTNAADYNSAFGYRSLYYNTTGAYNSAQGMYALNSNTTGAYNSAQGYSALATNTTGSYNSAQGAYALDYLTGAYDNNTAIGYNAGRYYNGTAGALTAISNSLFLGASADALNGAGDTNEIVIGYDAIGNGSNSVVLGNDSITKTILKGKVGIGTTSPTQKLDVNGSVNIGGSLVVGSNLSVGGTLTLSATPTGIGTSVLYISATGLVTKGVLSVGTTYATINGLNLNGSNQIGLGGTLSADTRLNIGNTDVMYFQLASGYVGIGTTNPNNLLSVYDLIDFNNTDFNTKLGFQSGKNIVAGAQYNTFVGYQAGLSSNTLSTNAADYNSAFGYQSLYSNTTGYNNSAQGSYALFSNTTGNSNSAQGAYALYFNTTGSENSAMGMQALYSNTTGSNNSAQGSGALYANTGSYNSAQGSYALSYNTTGNNNSAQGAYALYSNDTGMNNSAMGVEALLSNTEGYGNSAMGVYALDFNTTGSENSAMGAEALYSNDTGMNNSAMGVYALEFNTTGSYNSAQGSHALFNLVGAYNNNTAIGYNAGRYSNGTAGALTAISNSLFLGASASALNATGDDNEIVIGYNAIGLGSNSVVLGNDSIIKTILKGNVGIGTTNPNNLLSVYDLVDFNNTDFNTKLGFQSGKNIVAGAQYNTFVGYQAGLSSNTLSTNAADYNSAFGYQSLYSNTTGFNNSAQGAYALYLNTTGYNNSAQGADALYYNTTGNFNSAQGSHALFNNTTGFDNSAQGADALYFNTTGNRNSAQGSHALFNLVGAYNNNTAIGYNAGRYSNGTAGALTDISNSLFLGASASALNATGDDNEIVIGYNAIGNGSNSVVLGNDSITKTILKGNVGIGTTNPLAKLHVAGDASIVGELNMNNFYITNGTQPGNSNFIGYQAGLGATNASNSNFFGQYAGINAISAYSSNFIGYDAGDSADSADNSNFLGSVAGQRATNASYSNFIGFSAGMGATNASDSIFIGTWAGYNDTVNNGTTGTSIAIGRYAGTGGFSNSIALGRGVINSGTTQANIGNVLYINGIYNSDTRSSTPTTGGRVGIGTASPLYRLDIAASSPADYGMRLTNVGSGGTAAADKGLLIRLGTGASRPTSNYFIAFSNAVGVGGTVTGKIQGLGSSGVSYTTNLADYAEYFKILNGDPKTSPGYIMQIAPNSATTKAISGKPIGVVSDSGGFIGNGPSCPVDNDAECMANLDNYNVLVGMMGQIHTYVSTENGPIVAGDALAVSSIPGVAAKAIKAGFTVGHALEDYNKPIIARINAYINPSWYDPQPSLTDNSLVFNNYSVSKIVLDSIGYSGSKNEIETTTYGLGDTLGNPITRIGLFGQLFVAKINAGLITVKNLIADNIAVKHLASENIVTEDLTAQNIGASEATFSVVHADLIISPEGNITDVIATKINNLREEVKNILIGQTLSDSPPLTQISFGGIPFNYQTKLDGIKYAVAELQTERIAPLIDSDGNPVEIKIDGNVKINGVLTVDSIITNSIEGLDISNQIIGLNERYDQLKSEILGVNSSLAMMSVIPTGTVSPTPTTEPTNILTKVLAEFWNKVLFKGQTEFEKNPLFNKDMAGLAILNAGETGIEVKFENNFEETPIVNISLIADSDEESQTLAENYIYYIANRSRSGFFIRLNKSAKNNIKFSWTALLIKDVKTFQNQVTPTVIITPELIPTIIPIPSESVSPTVTPSELPTLMPTLEVSLTPTPVVVVQ